MASSVFVLGSVDSFLNSVGKFFANLASLNWLDLLIGLALFATYLSIRARAYFHTLQAAYPEEPIAFRKIWGAYVAAFGFNNAIPARSGDLIRLFLVKTSIPHATYPAIASSFLVELIFDICVGVPVLIFAFSQGVFPKPPDFANLHAFDLSFFASHTQLVFFIFTVVVLGMLLVYVILGPRFRVFWDRIKQGVVILSDHKRYFREVFAVQFVAWCFRLVAVWFFLDAFHIGGSARNVALVLAVNVVSSFVPLTPGGAGVQQALLVKVFAGAAAGATVAAYSVGQQIAIGVFAFSLGFFALVTIFDFRSFREVVFHARAAHQAHKDEERGVRDAERGNASGMKAADVSAKPDTAKANTSDATDIPSAPDSRVNKADDDPTER